MLKLEKDLQKFVSDQHCNDSPHVKVNIILQIFNNVYFDENLMKMSKIPASFLFMLAENFPNKKKEYINHPCFKMEEYMDYYLTNFCES